MATLVTVLLGFSTLSGTNPQVLHPTRYGGGGGGGRLSTGSSLPCSEFDHEKRSKTCLRDNGNALWG